MFKRPLPRHAALCGGKVHKVILEPSRDFHKRLLAWGRRRRLVVGGRLVGSEKKRLTNVFDAPWPSDHTLPDPGVRDTTPFHAWSITLTLSSHDDDAALDLGVV